MKPSYEEILSIQRNVDIVDIIKDYINLTPRGKNFFGICPFHDDHSPSMSVSKDRQMYRCFVCGASGNVFNFVKNYENISYYSAIKKVADKVGLSFSYKEKEPFIERHKKDLRHLPISASHRWVPPCCNTRRPCKESTASGTPYR